ncbi:substrate-binding domain-containing protein, partial [Serratia ureilytica]
SDQHAAGAAAVAHLIARGHRDIAFITGSLDSPTGLERLSGYKSALAQQGIAVNEALIVEGKWNAQSGVAAVDALLAGGQPFSAIVAGNDEMAIGAMKRLAERGVAV